MRLSVFKKRDFGRDNPIDVLAHQGKKAEGLIHVGAHDGDEVKYYRSGGLNNVVYIEPLPHIFEKLERKLTRISNHVALQELCWDKDDEIISFNIASNDGQSSSAFPMSAHKDIWPEIVEVDTIELTTVTLDTILARPRFENCLFDYLVVDAQGAELRILSGAKKALEEAKYLYLEVSEVRLYDGGCNLDEVVSFTRDRGFSMRWMELGFGGVGNAFFMR